MPDMNPFLKQTNGGMGLVTGIRFLFRRKFTVGLRAVMAGVKKEFKRLGAPIVVFQHLDKLLRDHKQIQFLECEWNLEDNRDINELEIEMRVKKYSTYKIYRKSVS